MLFYEIHNADKKEWIVCLHAVCTGNFIFDKQVEMLKTTYNVLLIELPGHGRSKMDTIEGVSQPFRYTAEKILEVLAYLHIEKAHFLGISLGTVVIHELIKIKPKVVMSACFGGAVYDFNFIAKKILKTSIVLYRFLPYSFTFKLLMHILMPKTNRKIKDSIFCKGKQIGRTNFLLWLKALNELEKVFEHKMIDNQHIKSLYVSGEDDYLLLSKLKSNVKTNHMTQFVVMKNVGHMCNMENSVEFNSLLMNFLKR